MGSGGMMPTGASYLKLAFLWLVALFVGLSLLLGFSHLSSISIELTRCLTDPSVITRIQQCNQSIRVVEKIVERTIAVPSPTGNIDIPGLISKGNKFEPRKPVPKILHYAWYSKMKLTMRFHHYVSIVAALKFIKPEKVMFWYERQPEGQYWEEIKEKINKTSRLMMMHRVGPTSIYGNEIEVEEHKSDVVRLEAVLLHGGIYMDLDVITLKPLDKFMNYDTTMGYELPNWLCNGFIMSKPLAPFLKIWHTEYITFNDDNWNYHSVLLPGILANNYPFLVHTEWDTIHRPNWQETNKIYGKGVKYDWSRNYAMHLWYRKYNKDHNKEDIKTLDSTLGEMFRYVLHGSKDIIR